MFYYSLYYLHEHFSYLNVLRYISFRAAMAAATALFCALFLGPWVVRVLTRFQCLENISRDHEGLYEKHKGKSSTPSMGGFIILGAIVLALLLWADWSNFYIQIVMGSLVAMGFLGFVDDYLKCRGREQKGLGMKTKFFWQLVFVVFIGSLIYVHNPDHLSLTFPFVKDFSWNLGWVYVCFMFLVILATCNAVNITDGLDGLAAGTLVMSFSAYLLIAYIAGHYGLSHYLHLPYVPGAGELTVVCAAAVGGCLGFLWFNAHPASVFMGDTGSLTLGSLLGLVAVLVKQELLLLIVGGVFVVETCSVIIQIVYCKCTGKRFFLIAPIHHHFEMKGIPETKIVIRFWIIAALCAIVGICTIKIR